MKTQLKEKYFMRIKADRDVLPWKVNSFWITMCAPPSDKNPDNSICQSERMSLCTLKGSLTLEAALVLPFFLMILLAFFSFFSQYASAAEIKVSAAAEAKKTGITLGAMEKGDAGDVTIYKSAQAEGIWINPFYREKTITQSAACRAWIGFTELKTEETYVYITPEGSVYHLYADCTHLSLSVQSVTMTFARSAKNEYGERYRQCELCKGPFQGMVFITSEGNRYHSKRSCSGLKRTVRQVPLSSVSKRRGCLRCMSRGE